MQLIRREFLQLAGVAAAATGVSPVAIAQSPGPKLTQILRGDLTGQGNVVQESVASIVEFGPGVAAPWHMHPGAQEILYVHEGSLIVEVDGRAPAVIKAGEAALVPADVPHLARNESATSAARALAMHSRSAKDKALVVPVKRAS
jgi:quercetin dioxygenase-like cupin family protein